MTTPTWPTIDEYDRAMQLHHVTVHDDDIRNGTLHEDLLGIRRYSGANLYVCMYGIDNWMVRCFRSDPPRQPPPDIEERYQIIARFCHDHMEKASALLETCYIDPGIDVPIFENDKFVKQRTLPIVKMPFLEATALGDFIATHYEEKRTMEALCDAWLRMVGELEDVQMAHGDLDLTNVLVLQQGSKLTLKLIDYDNIWIPPLRHFKQTEHGHKSFQHPAFWTPNDRPYDAEMDRFSALVIYISLKALAIRPELYDDFGADDIDRLLLSSDDFQREANYGKTKSPQMADNRIQHLYSIGILDILPYIEELKVSLYEDRLPARLDSIASSTLAVPSSFDSFAVPDSFIWEDIEYLQPASTQLQQAEQPIRSEQLEIPTYMWDRVEYLPSHTQIVQPEEITQPTQQELLPAFVWEVAEHLPTLTQPEAQPVQQPEPVPADVWNSKVDVDAPTEPMPYQEPQELIPRISAEAQPVPNYSQEPLLEEEVPVQITQGSNETRELIVGAIALIVIAAIIIGIVLFVLWRFGIIFQPSHSSLSHDILPLTWVSQNTVHLFPIHRATASFALHEKLL